MTTLEFNVKAAQVTKKLDSWIGLDAPQVREVKSIVWALAQDQDLRVAFDALVKAELINLNRWHVEDAAEQSIDHDLSE